MHHPAEAAAYLESLRRIVQYLGVSEAEMSRGELRCDANVSVCREGEVLGTKTEVKNLNSIRMVEKAIEAEAARQVALLAAGEPVRQATLLWDEKRGAVREMRLKEDADDYRYFPEPDLPPLAIDAPRRRRARAAVGELPFARRDRLVAEHGITPYAAGVLSDSRELADWYEALASACGDASLAANWTLGEVLRIQKETGASLADFPLGVDALAGLLGMVKDGRISDSVAKRVLAVMIETGRTAKAVVEEEGWAQLSDEAELASLVDEVLAGHAEQVEQYRSGNEKVVSFLVGQVMKASGGRANPKVARELLGRRMKGG
jgi:aspartyl-tRNA(Asn)/glutamyl-tRNA(Gln) amidotransferase subunit B